MRQQDQLAEPLKQMFEQVKKVLGYATLIAAAKVIRKSRLRIIAVVSDVLNIRND